MPNQAAYESIYSGMRPAYVYTKAAPLTERGRFRTSRVKSRIVLLGVGSGLRMAERAVLPPAVVLPCVLGNLAAIHAVLSCRTQAAGAYNVLESSCLAHTDARHDAFSVDFRGERIVRRHAVCDSHGVHCSDRVRDVHSRSGESCSASW